MVALSLTPYALKYAQKPETHKEEKKTGGDEMEAAGDRVSGLTHPKGLHRRFSLGQARRGDAVIHGQLVHRVRSNDASLVGNALGQRLVTWCQLV